MNGGLTIGVDVGGTNIRIGAVGRDMSLKDARIFSSGELGNENPAENLLLQIKSYIAGLDEPADAVSIGFPSTIDKARGRLISTPNLEGFDNLPVKEIYERALGVPVFISKDATMLLFCDVFRLGLEKYEVVAGIYYGTGIGNSVIIGGKELTGFDGAAGELGHIPFPGHGDVCGCGLRGCAELYAGGKALAKIRAEDFPDVEIGDIFEVRGDSPQIRRFLEDAACVAAAEINILNPGCVVLGGGVLAMKGFPKEQFRREILSRTRGPVPGENLKIVFSDVSSPYNGVVGSAVYAMKMMQERRGKI